MLDGVEHRPCFTCGELKMLTEFYRYKSGYYDNDCKPCARKRAIAHRHANLERARENSRQYYRTNPEVVIAHTIKRRDIQRSGQPGEEISVREVAEAFGWICQLCLLPIDPDIRHRQWECEPMGLSLDHIVPLTRGGLHVRTNVQPAHLVCNVRKQNRLEEGAAGWAM
jgi:5-methylcytosine-specific restriction endonuclease McrA